MTHLSYQIIFSYNRLNLNMCVFSLISYKQDNQVLPYLVFHDYRSYRLNRLYRLYRLYRLFS
uniref:Uncharacterized protein n=1 Tax=uncultured marine crenarchaeote HF4000_APKG10L15 TaxID=455613 RepID=B3TCL3_9ARCH|nr:hypothetical protein ALOHA_HF4000APKG10L15ctg1g25 [uncultured marine crenarchaeote HF4000_APKG10L15]